MSIIKSNTYCKSNYDNAFILSCEKGLLPIVELLLSLKVDKINMNLL